MKKMEKIDKIEREVQHRSAMTANSSHVSLSQLLFFLACVSRAAFVVIGVLTESEAAFTLFHSGGSSRRNLHSDQCKVDLEEPPECSSVNTASNS